MTVFTSPVSLMTSLPDTDNIIYSKYPIPVLGQSIRHDRLLQSMTRTEKTRFSSLIAERVSRRGLKAMRQYHDGWTSWEIIRNILMENGLGTSRIKFVVADST